MSPVVLGKKRCRMHGGAKGSGAPKGNQNALKLGLYTKAWRAEKAEIRKQRREADKMFREGKKDRRARGVGSGTPG
jgi:uncharacterized protein YjcR